MVALSNIIIHFYAFIYSKLRKIPLFNCNVSKRIVARVGYAKPSHKKAFIVNLFAPHRRIVHYAPFF